MALDIVYSTINAAILASIILLLRKLLLWFQGKTLAQRDLEYAVAKTRRSIVPPNFSCDLKFNGLIGHESYYLKPAGDTSFRVWDFKSSIAYMQNSGSCFLVTCHFERVNPFDQYPLLLTSGTEAFESLIEEPIFRQLKRIGFDFSLAYQVRIQKIGVNEAIAELVYSESHPVEPICLELNRLKQKRSKLKNMFF